MTKSLNAHNNLLAQTLRAAARSVLSVRSTMPTMERIAKELEDAEAALARGYFTPDEDERLRTSFMRYLQMRINLWETVLELHGYIELPRQFKKGDWDAHLQAFAISFVAACVLVRTGYFLIDAAHANEVVRDKLDEAEPRYGIARKQFTHIYDSLISTRRMARYFKAVRFYNRNQADIMRALAAPEFVKIGEALRFEEQYFEASLSDHFKRKLKFGGFSLSRRGRSAAYKTSFFIFETLGSEIADLKQPLVKPIGAGKRVSADIRKRLIELSKPGDIYITRHDDALSNVFLPGFWPHAALFIGSDRQRQAIGVPSSNAKYQSFDGDVVFLESKKDGVLFRPASDTLHLDVCVVLRPKLEPDQMSRALRRALTHAGKQYDFVFDFSTADRIVCTELIYRAYHGFGGMDFVLSERAGRLCLSAEDLLNQGLGNDWFEVVALYGLSGEEILRGQDAREKLQGSFNFSPTKTQTMNS